MPSVRSLLDKVFICLLCVLFVDNGLVLHSLGIIDDGLDHALNTTSLLVLAVVLESRWWGRTSWLLLRKSDILESCVLLVIETLQDLKSCVQQFLSSTLIL